VLAVACACDGGTSAPPVDPDDLDGDGILNAQDVCPLVQDPPQHDEDGDGVGDLCDVCPTVADPLQRDRGEVDANAFEDGVGDACDLRPSRGGDKLRALHTFATDTSSSWLGAGWTIADDRVHAVAAVAARWQNRRSEQGDAVFARLSVESVVFAADGAALAISLDGDGLESGRSCALFADRNEDGRDELELREVGGPIVIRELAVALDRPFELIVLRGVDRAGAGKVLCRLQFPDDEVEASFDTADGVGTGQYVLAATGADVIVTALAVYGSPTACPSLVPACPLP
jgi:hypothetical protein